MDGNEWNEFTTPEFKVYQNPDPFVRSYKSDKPKSIDERVSAVAEEKRNLQREQDKKSSSSSKVDIPETPRNNKESNLELEPESVNEAALDEESSSEDKSSKPKTKKVCRVGSKVSKIEEGELLCVSVGEVPKCSQRESDCSGEQRVPVRHVKSTHVCLPRDSKTLKAVAKKFELEEDLVDLQEKKESVDLQELVRALEKSPRSSRKEFGIDSCWVIKFLKNL